MVESFAQFASDREGASMDTTRVNRWFGFDLSKLASSVILLAFKEGKQFLPTPETQETGKRKRTLRNKLVNPYKFYTKLCLDNLGCPQTRPLVLPDSSTVQLKLTPENCWNSILINGRILLEQDIYATLSMRYILASSTFQQLRRTSTSSHDCDSDGILFGCTLNAIVVYANRTGCNVNDTRAVVDSAVAVIRNRIAHPSCTAGAMSRIGCGLHYFHGDQHRDQDNRFCSDPDHVFDGPPVVVSTLVAVYACLHTLIHTKQTTALSSKQQEWDFFSKNPVILQILERALELIKCEMGDLYQRATYQQNMHGVKKLVTFQADGAGFNSELAAVKRAINAVRTAPLDPLAQLLYFAAAAWPISTISSNVKDRNVWLTEDVNAVSTMKPISDDTTLTFDAALATTGGIRALRIVGLMSFLLRHGLEQSVCTRDLLGTSHFTQCMHFRLNVGGILPHVHPAIDVDYAATIADALGQAIARSMGPQTPLYQRAASALRELLLLAPHSVVDCDCVLTPKKKIVCGDADLEAAREFAASMGHSCDIPQRTVDGVRYYCFSSSIMSDLSHGRRGK